MAANLSQLPSFSGLNEMAIAISDASVSELLRQDPARAQDFCLQAAGLQLDYSKQLLDRDRKVLGRRCGNTT